jgi:hypothetical protein
MAASAILTCGARHAPETDLPLVESILSAWCVTDDATRESGAAWYPEAQAVIDGMWPEHADRARGIVAALSPRVHWATTLVWSRTLIDSYRSGATEPPNVSTGANRAAAWRIASGERPLDVLGGHKTRNFYRNLSGNRRAVTVDVWAARVAGLEMPNGRTLTARQYAEIANAYRRAARLAGTDPSTLQAATWIAARGKAD